MKFVLFCEGWTEKGALPEFLRRWLNSNLQERIGIQPVRFKGWSELVRESAVKAHLHLRHPDVIAVVALLDLYGPTFYPTDRETVAERVEWAKVHLEEKVNHPRFRQHFAVHDIEAWILSQPEVLPSAVGKKLKNVNPETVNFDNPPSRLLGRLYEEATGFAFKKRTYGEELFRKLDPRIVREKCPHFRKLADDLLDMARKALETRG